MSHFIREIRTSFGNARSLYRLMVINVVAYLIVGVTGTLFFLFNVNDAVIQWVVRELSMPSQPALFLLRPWTIFTYMFVHTSFMHILFNLVVLSWTGRLFTEYLGNDKLWATYILGGLCGGLFYFLGFNLLPVFSSLNISATLIGASAGVVAILVAIATLLPDYTVQLMLVGPVRLKYLAVFLVVLYILSLRDGNAGGQFAHLGGAFFGFIMVKQLRRGRDLTGWLVKFGKRFGGNKSSHLKVVSRSAAASDTRHREAQVASQEAIDRILDKINKSGFDSLTATEKEILYKASGKK